MPSFFLPAGLVNLNALFARFVETKKERDMKFLTLQDIKAQCRIEPDFTDEDTLLQLYGAAAENTLLRICNRSVDDIIELFGEDNKMPSDFIVAGLLLAKHLYEHRGPTQNVPIAMVPYTIDMLIMPFMKLGAREEE